MIKNGINKYQLDNIITINEFDINLNNKNKMEKKEFAKGIFITEKESKTGKPYLEIAIGENGAYKSAIINFPSRISA